MREDATDELTSGYIKDLNHMKEMLFRQQRSVDSDLFEV